MTFVYDLYKNNLVFLMIIMEPLPFTLFSTSLEYFQTTNKNPTTRIKAWYQIRTESNFYHSCRQLS